MFKKLLSYLERTISENREIFFIRFSFIISISLHDRLAQWIFFSLFFFSFYASYETHSSHFLSLSLSLSFLSLPTKSRAIAILRAYLKYRRRWPWLRTALVAETKAVPLIFDTWRRHSHKSRTFSNFLSFSPLFRAYKIFRETERGIITNEIYSFFFLIFSTSAQLRFLLPYPRISTDNAPRYAVNSLRISDRYYYLHHLSFTAVSLFLYI